MLAQRFKKIRRKLVLLGLHELLCVLELSVAEIPVPIRGLGGRPAPMNFDRMEALLKELNIECSARFRFQGFHQLRSLTNAFNIPENIVTQKG